MENIHKDHANVLRKQILLSGQFDKLCFSVHPPNRKELGQIVYPIMYFCWDDKTLDFS